MEDRENAQRAVQCGDFVAVAEQFAVDLNESGNRGNVELWKQAKTSFLFTSSSSAGGSTKRGEGTQGSTTFTSKWENEKMIYRIFFIEEIIDFASRFVWWKQCEAESCGVEWIEFFRSEKSVLFVDMKDGNRGNFRFVGDYSSPLFRADSFTRMIFNIFRILGDLCHLLSFIVLIVKIKQTKSCYGERKRFANHM